MSLAQGVSPGRDKRRVMNPLSLWERARVREALKGRNSSFFYSRVDSCGELNRQDY